MQHSEWERLVRGTACPFDAPRQSASEYRDLVARLEVSSLYLAANQTYRGQCLLILDIRHATQPDELSELAPMSGGLAGLRSLVCWPVCVRPLTLRV
jgi:hypothetical protein